MPSITDILRKPVPHESTRSPYLLFFSPKSEALRTALAPAKNDCITVCRGSVQRLYEYSFITMLRGCRASIYLLKLHFGRISYTPSNPGRLGCTSFFPSDLFSSSFSSLLLIVVTQIQGHKNQALSPPPHYCGACLALSSREEFSIFFPRRLGSNRLADAAVIVTLLACDTYFLPPVEYYWDRG